MIRNRNRSVRFLPLVLGAMLLAAPAAYAGGADWNGHRHQTREQRLQQRLGLTDDQMQSIREIHQRDAAAYKQTWQSLRRARAELRQLALTGGDESAIAAKSDEVAQLMAQTVTARTATLRQIAQVLTPEQREKFAQMNVDGHRGRGRGPRQSNPS